MNCFARPGRTAARRRSGRVRHRRVRLVEELRHLDESRRVGPRDARRGALVGRLYSMGAGGGMGPSPSRRLHQAGGALGPEPAPRMLSGRTTSPTTWRRTQPPHDRRRRRGTRDRRRADLRRGDRVLPGVDSGFCRGREDRRRVALRAGTRGLLALRLERLLLLRRRRRLLLLLRRRRFATSFSV